ncbi:hypothetical protein SAMN06265355_12616 [Actinomadura mexicana]|uniref:Uncharacterized protein n=1 Tax=Actinomadura mexicana TaxID=134959 RepID=A0A239GSQ8_9ACTN|nr:hypothetical protein SAMN06265355_12616 [Actinomadura mexicana]
MLAIAISVIGPPPLARGELAAGDRDDGAGRTTPARAGRTPRAGPGWPRRADHPRSRGENLLAADTRLARHGPPPLARGELVKRGRRLRRGRTTPARAGRTWPARRRPPCRADHPRSRGENMTIAVQSVPNGDHPRSHGENGIVSPASESDHGPPPLARGERHRVAGERIGPRTTPARAGRTAGPRPSPPRAADPPARAGRTGPGGPQRQDGLGPPPLARGEHDDRGAVRPERGPPPLARGERSPVDHQHAAARTTPARAGRTAARRTGVDRLPDHPRSRGENASRACPSRSVPVADHPRSRGERLGLAVVLQPRRTTPARAGRTAARRTGVDRLPDHPRSRGENASRACPSRSVPVADHPRSRGERLGLAVVLQPRRTTPARAGRTLTTG